MRGNSKRFSNPGKRRILQVDDVPIVCVGFASLVNSEADLEVVGQVAQATAAFEAIDQLKPDLIVLDISLEGISGIELIKVIKSRHPKLPILVFSLNNEAEYAERALRAGANGYVMKRSPAADVLQAIRDILHGENYLSKRMQSLVVERFMHGKRTENGFGVELLSDRELEVFEGIGRGQKTKEIAKRLHLSVKTIETHRSHIKRKINLKNGMELVCSAIQWLNTREKQLAIVALCGAALAFL